MRVVIHLPRGLTVGENQQLILTGLREAERIRRQREAERRLRKAERETSERRRANES